MGNNGKLIAERVDVIVALRTHAFARPGSPRELQHVVVFIRSMNHPGSSSMGRDRAAPPR